MDPTGGEIIDQVISDSEPFANAFGNNDMMTINQMLKDSQKSMELLALHITQPQVQKFFRERIVAFHSVVACLNQGKCGSQAISQYLFGCIDPMRTLFSTLLD